MAKNSHGVGAHVLRIYDHALWTRVSLHAKAAGLFENVIVAAALVEYLKRHRTPDPALQAAVWEERTPMHAVRAQRSAATRKANKLRMATGEDTDGRQGQRQAGVRIHDAGGGAGDGLAGRHGGAGEGAGASVDPRGSDRGRAQGRTRRGGEAKIDVGF